MSSDSHATITYTSMSSYEVIVKGYFGMPMDPLDPYAQLVMEAPPSPDYIRGPEAPPSPEYIPRPEYPEYLPPADDVFSAEEQPLPATVSPTAELPRYIADSEPKMDPEEEDGDDEKSEGDSIDYSTSRGDDDADDDGDDLSKDDADEGDEEESSDSITQSGEDAPIKGRSLDEGEEVAEKGSDDTEEMVTILTSLDAVSILTSGVSVSISLVTEVSIAEVPTGSGSIPTASPPGTGVPTGSGMVPTASPILTTVTESTPYTRRKGKEKMVESKTHKKKKLQKQIDVQVARELEEEMERDAQRMNEQIAKDAEIARIHTEEELHMMIDGLDRNNETVAKYLQEYHQFATQQRKPLSRKQQKEFYMSVLKSHAGWKARHFKGMTLEEIKVKFDPVWKQFQDFIPIGSKEEVERFKRKGPRLEQDSAKKVKTSEEVSEEKLKEMMQLIPIEEVYKHSKKVSHIVAFRDYSVQQSPCISRNQGNNHGNVQGNNQGRNQFFQGASHGQNPPPAYQASGYQAPVHQALIPQLQVVTTTKFTNYMKANDAILKNMQTNMTSLTISNLELKNMFGQFMKINTSLSLGLRTLPSNTITNPKEDFKGITTQSGNACQGPTIPTTSSPPKLVECKTDVANDTMPPTNNGSTKDVQPLVVQVETQILNSEPVEAPISALKPNPKPFADALILMPKFGPTIKSLLTNKEKLFELARTPLNEHYSVVLLKKLPEKLGDPSKFPIPCDFSRIDECLSLVDLGASINLMPLSVWNNLSLPKLSPTCMTLKLTDRSISRSTGRALIDVYEGELKLQVGNKAITFNLDQTSRYSANYDAMSVNRIELIDVAYEETLKNFLDFPDFLFEETDAFLAIDDEPISPKINESYYDSEGDILFLEEFLNDDPSSQPLPPQELKVVEPKNKKSFIDEPPVVELKDLPPHLEYAFLEGDDKLPVIIAKDLKDEEKTALIKVLKSHKQAFAWQLSDIKGIKPEFCTHKILMEDDFKPVVHHQRRVNLKIHEVIKKEEKSHFMVKEGIILGHKISKNRIEVDKAKVDVIAKLPHPTTVKGIRSFLVTPVSIDDSYKIFQR
uniref:Reverse transcriptase domain-containing protein n=1 Tax=Tanacetum cinerariifolium TaxID=118510 RepID=A0A699GVL6_TANCI|nr:hypothetical protein [Tanacetum cinerariifolium]